MLYNFRGTRKARCHVCHLTYTVVTLEQADFCLGFLLLALRLQGKASLRR